MTLRHFSLIAVALSVALASALIDADPLYFLSAFLLMIPVAAYLFGQLTVRHLRLAPVAASPVMSGETVEFPIEVENRGFLPRFQIRLRAALPPGLTAEGARRDSALFAGPPVRGSERSSEGEIAVIPGKGRAIGICLARTLRRGLFSIGPVTITHMDPLQLAQVTRLAPFRQEAIVYPRPLGVPLSTLLGGDLMGSERTARSRGSADGSDFFGIRPYRMGDEWRRIHWPSTARAGVLMVIEREALASLSLLIVLDLTAAPGDTESAPLEVLIRLAAQMAEEAIRRVSAIYLALLHPDGRLSLALERCMDRTALLDTLARIDVSAPAETRPVDRLSSLAGQGPSLALLTDRMDARIDAVADVARKNTWPAAVILFDPTAQDSGTHSKVAEKHESRESAASVPVWRLRAEGGSYCVEPLARL
ncbi:MAG TPA: DUF58 domain-containing protein [Armatimonadota bacterium]|nr:DUF58 domain-containing protein [Armatimonadota bacterium]